jgi:hypothetical protein
MGPVSTQAQLHHRKQRALSKGVNGSNSITEDHCAEEFSETQNGWGTE